MKDRLAHLKPSRSQLSLVAAFALAATLAVGTASASSICNSSLVSNVLEPLLEAAFQLGPLLGAFSGIVSLVMMSQVTSKDKKKKWKERRNDAFLYGVIGVMVSGYIIQFIAQDVMGLQNGCLNTGLIGAHLTAHLADLAAFLL